MCKLTKDMVLEAIEGSSGIIQAIAEKCGCSWHTVKKFLDNPENRDVLPILASERETLIDLAESKLKQAVVNGEPWAIKYTLSRLGKERGYKEKHPEEVKKELEAKQRREEIEQVEGLLVKFPEPGLDPSVFKKYGWRIMRDKRYPDSVFAMIVREGNECRRSYEISQEIMNFPVDPDARF